MKKITVILMFLVITVLVLPLSVEAWNPRLDNAHYLVRGSTENIESLQFKLGFGFDRFNSFDTLFVYNGDNLDLQGSWLINFTGDQNLDMNLRLNLSTKLADRSLKPAIGIGGEFPIGNSNYTFWALDYYFNVTNNNFVYKAGIGFPITNNSDLTLGFGNTFWRRNTSTVGIGLKVGF
ncbi:MAG: hypothetical protein ACOCZZ_00135 [Bacillota bacterium]